MKQIFIRIGIKARFLCANTTCPLSVARANTRPCFCISVTRQPDTGIPYKQVRCVGRSAAQRCAGSCVGAWEGTRSVSAYVYSPAHGEPREAQAIESEEVMTDIVRQTWLSTASIVVPELVNGTMRRGRERPSSARDAWSDPSAPPSGEHTSPHHTTERHAGVRPSVSCPTEATLQSLCCFCFMCVFHSFRSPIDETTVNSAQDFSAGP